MQIDILSLFPEYFRSPLEVSMLKRAIQSGIITVNLVNIRDYSTERYRKVDDRPYGGGPGMVMMPGPLTTAIRAQKKEGSKTIYLTPQGAPLTALRCRQLAQEKQLILVCGHYEGIDERVIESDIDDEISIGDYVLTNGCLASLVLLDAVVRFIPGVLGDDEAAGSDSFENEGLLDWPHYTRPELFEDKKVPDVLLSGNHKEIAAWRREQAEKKTKEVRPDLWQKYLAKS
jgi:tRNA (guanine37-N1)-methyltransferase